MRRIPMKMKDWIDKLHGFLELNDRNILTDAGKISHELVIEFAKNEYDKFHEKRLSQQVSEDSDFEKAIGLVGKNKHKKKSQKKTSRLQSIID